MTYATVAQLREYLPQVPDLGQQTIAVTGSPTGGTFTLVYEGTATAGLAHNATATAVQTALRAISAIGTSGVKVTGRPGAWVATFQGVLATDAGPLTLGTNSLTGGTTPSVTVASTQDALLQHCLDRAESIIDEALDWSFAAWGAAGSRTIRTTGGPFLYLPPHQAGSVTSVVHDGETLANYAETDKYDLEIVLTTEASDDPYIWNATLGAHVWDAGLYTVTATWGYGPAPQSIIELELELAVNIWRSRDRGLFTEIIGAEDGGAIRYIGGLNSQQRLIIASVLQSYKPLRGKNM